LTFESVEGPGSGHGRRVADDQRLRAAGGTDTQRAPVLRRLRLVATGRGATDEIPALACVLLELGEDEVTLVATDRYQLSIRKLHPNGFTGYPRNLLVRAAELIALARWAAAAAEVRLETGPTGTALVRDGEARDIPVITAEFPAYQSILEGLAPPVCRVVLDRLKLAELLTDGTVALDIEPGSLTVTPLDGSAGSDGSPQSDGSVQLGGSGRLDAICSGSAIRLGFDAVLLTAALTASVGPDVLLATLVMPTRLDG
jgi:DNA polymerase III subunit beta